MYVYMYVYIYIHELFMYLMFFLNIFWLLTQIVKSQPTSKGP